MKNTTKISELTSEQKQALEDMALAMKNDNYIDKEIEAVLGYTFIFYASPMDDMKIIRATLWKACDALPV